MPPKSESKDVELKVRVPKELSKRIDSFWHQQELKNRKAAVVALLELGLSNGKRQKQVDTLKTE